MSLTVKTSGRCERIEFVSQCLASACDDHKHSWLGIIIIIIIITQFLTRHMSVKV